MQEDPPAPARTTAAPRTPARPAPGSWAAPGPAAAPAPAPSGTAPGPLPALSEPTPQAPPPGPPAAGHSATTIERGSFCLARCTCGWAGPARRSRDRARTDAAEHLATP
ncbi:hypothetical protein ACIQMO_33200 [Streptomyces sp. NPDC091406]|uniref:hypothetical protein n=1 Tax=unclassified Streptomyces TaxID=2593676 RepID=UPI0037FB12BD